MADDPQFQTTVPLDGWVEVRVDGEGVTCFSVTEGEDLSVHLSTDNPRDTDT